MHFQIKKDDIYIHVPEIIKKEFPDFVPMFNEDDGIYLIFGEFLRYLEYNKNNEIILKKTCKMLNYLLSEGGHKTEELIIIQIYDCIQDDNFLISFFKDNLDNNAKEKLEFLFK